MEKGQQNDRMFQEFTKRKASLEKRHEMELESLKFRQKKELEGLEARYSSMLKREKSDNIMH